MWVVPQRLGLFSVAWFFAHIQHPRDVLWEETPFQATVQVIAKPWTRWLLLGQSKHHMHHLAPSVPYYRYHRAWELGERLLCRQNIPTRTLWSPAKDLVLAKHKQPIWLQARVHNVMDVAAQVRSFEFVPADGNVWPNFSAGSHIDVCAGGDRVRQYSLCNSPDEENRYVVAVKHEPHGKGGSDYLHTAVKSGDLLQIGAPRNNFSLNSDFSDYVLIAGGIGVTPLLAMAHELHTSGKRFVLHICARSAAAVAFRDQLDELPFGQCIVTHVDDSGQDQRLDLAEDLGVFVPGRVLYLCGPSGFMSSVISQATDLSWSTDAIFSETFVPSKAEPSENTQFEVELARSGKVLTVGADESLLDVLNANDCAVICSCAQGICGSCMTPVLEGIPEHRDAIMTDAERATNQQMTVCVSRAQSDRLILDL